MRPDLAARPGPRGGAGLRVVIIINSQPCSPNRGMCGYLKLHVNRVLEKAKFPVAFLINTFLERGACCLRDPGGDILSKSEAFCLNSDPQWRPSRVQFSGGKREGPASSFDQYLHKHLILNQVGTCTPRGITLCGLFLGMPFPATIKPMAPGM